MLPADAIGMLDVTDKLDTGGQHGPAREVEILDSEPDHRACGEEGMKFVGRTVELQDSTVGKPEPDQVVGLPSDRDTDDIPEERNSFVQPITSDSNEVRSTFSAVIDRSPAARRHYRRRWPMRTTEDARSDDLWNRAGSPLRSRPNQSLELLQMVGTFSLSALLFASCLREISADWQTRSAPRPKRCAASRGRCGFARIETAS
jgi:hypothetical protein